MILNPYMGAAVEYIIVGVYKSQVGYRYRDTGTYRGIQDTGYRIQGNLGYMHLQVEDFR